MLKGGTSQTADFDPSKVNPQELMARYSPQEQTKFKAIFSAGKAKDTATMSQLMSQLSPTENIRFKEFQADMRKVQAHIEWQKSRISELQAQKRAQDDIIADATRKQNHIINQGASQVAASLKDLTLGSQRPAPASSAATTVSGQRSNFK